MEPTPFNGLDFSTFPIPQNLSNDLDPVSSISVGNETELQKQRLKEIHCGVHGSSDRKQEFVADVLNPIIPTINSSSPQFEKYKIWIGVIDELKKKSVVVSFFDMNDKDLIPRYQAEFDLKTYFKGDWKLLKEDTYVRWEIGYTKSLKTIPDSENLKFSVLNIIRFPKITEADWENALKEADELLDGFFDWNPNKM